MEDLKRSIMEDGLSEPLHMFARYTQHLWVVKRYHASYPACIIGFYTKEQVAIETLCKALDVPKEALTVRDTQWTHTSDDDHEIVQTNEYSFRRNDHVFTITYTFVPHFPEELNLYY